jgi:hypothetical protein
MSKLCYLISLARPTYPTQERSRSQILLKPMQPRIYRYLHIHCRYWAIWPDCFFPQRQSALWYLRLLKSPLAIIPLTYPSFQIPITASILVMTLLIYTSLSDELEEERIIPIWLVTDFPLPCLDHKLMNAVKLSYRSLHGSYLGSIRKHFQEPATALRPSGPRNLTSRPISLCTPRSPFPFQSAIASAISQDAGCSRECSG